MTIQTAVTVLKLDATQHDAAADKAAQAIGRVGLAGQNTAKQTAAAMRTLPAQFTDVATQLAGGQNPLLILLQQGGQVRDQFGSIGAAAKGIASVLSPVALGLGALAAGAGGLALAYKQASAEQDMLLRGLVMSGNAAGTTRNELNEMARAQDAVAGTQKLAVQTLGALAGSGQVAAAQLSMVTAAAINLERAGGAAVDETAKKFIQLGAAPLQTLVQLNQAENFLTRSVYEQVRALVERGEVAQAGAVAQEAYAIALNQRTRTLEADLGSIQRLWRGVTDFASEAWDAMLGIGRPDTLQQQLATAIKQLEEAGEPRRGGNNLQADARRAAIRQRIEDLRLEIYLQGEQAAADQTRAQREAQYFRDQSKRDAAARVVARPGRVEPPVMGDYLDRSDRLELAGRPGPDPLGEFINERVLPADQERNERRLEQQNKFLQDLTDASAQANLALIADDQLRALAQVDLERQMQQRRIEAIFEAGPQRAEAERQADAAADAQRQGVGMRYAKSTALFTRDEFANALSAAFQGSQNPARAFAEALGNVVFQRLTARIGDALATAFVGADGTGGLLGGLFSGFVGAFGGGTSDVGFASVAGISGGRASGGGVNRGALYEINEHDSPGEVLNTRSGRSYLLAGQDGEIVPARRRGAGGAGGGGGFSGEVRIRLTNVQGQAAEVSNARVGTDGGLDIEAEVRRIVVNDIARGGEIDRIASRTWGVNRASGLPRRG